MEKIRTRPDQTSEDGDDGDDGNMLGWNFREGHYDYEWWKMMIDDDTQW